MHLKHVVTPLLATFLLAQLSSGQTPASATPAANPNVKTLARLFRNENALVRLSAQASDSQSQAQLRSTIPKRFGLDATQQAILELTSQRWEIRTHSLREQFNSQVAQWKATIPATGYRPGRDSKPPASLASLRSQMDDVTRDAAEELRMQLGDEFYAGLCSNITAAYTGGLTATSPAVVQ